MTMRITRRDAIYFLVVSLLIGVFTDVLIRQRIFGLNFLIFSVLWTGISLFGAYTKKIVRPRFAVFAGLAFVNSLLVYIRSESVVQFWSVIITLTCLMLMTGALYANNFLNLSIVNKINAYLNSILKSDLSGSKHVYYMLNNKKTPANKRQFSSGIIIAFVLALVFIALFSGSDAVFRSQFKFIGDFLSAIGDWLGNYNLGRFFSIGFWTALSGAALITMAGREEPLKDSPSRIKRFLTKNDPEIILGTVSVIFLIFILIQIKYLFAGSSLPGNLTYAEYARKGYGELLLATMLASAVIYGSIAFTKDAVKTKVRTVLPSLLVVLNGIVVFSAWKRLSLYESAYGWTMTRFVARLGLISILLGSILLLLWVNKRLTKKQLFGYNWYAVALVLTIAAALNPVGIIVQKNISERSSRETPLDARYLNQLSADSNAALCKYMPSLKKSYPNEYEQFRKLRYPQQLQEQPLYELKYLYENHGLSAHYTSSQSYKQQFNCLK